MRIIIKLEHMKLEQSGLPYKFWEKVATHGIYAYNRCHLPKIGITPYEAFYRAKPDVSNLRIFGSLVYIYISKETALQYKYIAKAFRGIFTGYSSSGYRIWNLCKRIFVVSNYCTIKEYVKGVSLLNPASQLYRRLVGTIAESDDGSTDDSDNPDTDYGDTIIVDTGNQQLDDLLENDRENHSDTERGAAENASRDAIGGASGLNEPPEPLFENN